MPMSARWWYQCRESVEQLVRGEQHADFATRAGFLALVDEMLRVELTQPFLGTDRSSAVAQEAFQSLPVVGFDAHTGVKGEAVGEDAAYEVAAEFALGQCRGMAATAVVVQRQPGGEVILHHAAG